MTALGTEEEPFRFFLAAGKHTIQLEVGLGSEMSEIIRRADECISELNRAYRQLLIVIGSSPDMFRDYQLESKTPEALELFQRQFRQPVCSHRQPGKPTGADDREAGEHCKAVVSLQG